MQIKNLFYVYGTFPDTNKRIFVSYGYWKKITYSSIFISFSLY